MWVNWKKSQRAVGTNWANDQGRFLWSWPELVSNPFWWPRWTSTQGSLCDTTRSLSAVSACGGAGWCHCGRNIFRKDRPCLVTLLGCCFVLLTFFTWSAPLLSFKMLYGNSTNFLQHSIVVYCFFATELIEYDFRFYFKPELWICVHCR